MYTPYGEYVIVGSYSYQKMKRDNSTAHLLSLQLQLTIPEPVLQTPLMISCIYETAYWAWQPTGLHESEGE